MSRSTIRPSFGRKARTLAAVVVALAAAVFASPAPALAAVGTVRLPDPGTIALDEVDGGGAVWSLATDGNVTYLYRIDPVANEVTQRIVLAQDTPTGGFAYSGALISAAGSLWAVLTFHDQVLRIDPTSGAVQHRFRTGRYPSHLVYGDGSVWVLEAADQQVGRIDPATNAIVAQVAVGRQDAAALDQPFTLSWDEAGDRLLVTLPVTKRIAVIDGPSERVSYLHTGRTPICGRPLPVPGGFWMDDTPCSNDFYRWDDAAGTFTAHFTVEAPYNSSFGGVVTHGYLYTEGQTCGPRQCRHAALIKRDLDTGAALAVRPVGAGVAYLPSLAAGQIWVSDDQNNELLHLHTF